MTSREVSSSRKQPEEPVQFLPSGFATPFNTNNQRLKVCVAAGRVACGGGRDRADEQHRQQQLFRLGQRVWQRRQQQQRWRARGCASSQSHVPQPPARSQRRGRQAARQQPADEHTPYVLSRLPQPPLDIVPPTILGDISAGFWIKVFSCRLCRKRPSAQWVRERQWWWMILSTARSPSLPLSLPPPTSACFTRSFAVIVDLSCISQLDSFYFYSSVKLDWLGLLRVYFVDVYFLYSSRAEKKKRFGRWSTQYFLDLEQLLLATSLISFCLLWSFWWKRDEFPVSESCRSVVDHHIQLSCQSELRWI